MCTTSVVRGKNYVLTLWGKAGALQTVNGQGGTVKRVVGNNVLYEWFLYDPGTVTVTSDNCDEVRLIPEGASIATYTYDPYAGMTTKTDWNNLSIFYEYDEFGRLHFVRDHDKNLVKKINYNYRNGGNSTIYYNAPFYSDFMLRVCSGEPTHGQYVVPAGRYSSVLSQEEANNLAKLDAQQNANTWVQQNIPCSEAPLSVDYLKEGTVTFNVKFENLVTHAIYSFTFSEPAEDWEDDIYPHQGEIPRGRYDITFSTPSTAGHTFIIGSLGQSGTTTATFSNVSLTIPYQTFIIINGDQ